MYSVCERFFPGRTPNLSKIVQKEIAIKMSDSILPVESILRTKICLPKPGAQVLARGHLFSRLQDGYVRRLTLLCAPAGSGKTTQLADWLAQCGYSAAWLTLDHVLIGPGVLSQLG